VRRFSTQIVDQLAALIGNLAIGVRRCLRMPSKPQIFVGRQVGLKLRQPKRRLRGPATAGLG
jgi:hypothetical protein